MFLAILLNSNLHLWETGADNTGRHQDRYCPTSLHVFSPRMRLDSGTVAQCCPHLVPKDGDRSILGLKKESCCFHETKLKMHESILL
jgi:hypothetical protein